MLLPMQDQRQPHQDSWRGLSPIWATQLPQGLPATGNVLAASELTICAEQSSDVGGAIWHWGWCIAPFKLKAGDQADFTILHRNHSGMVLDDALHGWSSMCTCMLKIGLPVVYIIIDYTYLYRHQSQKGGKIAQTYQLRCNSHSRLLFVWVVSSTCSFSKGVLHDKTVGPLLQELLDASDTSVSFHRFNARLPGSASPEEFHEARRAVAARLRSWEVFKTLVAFRCVGWSLGIRIYKPYIGLI